MSIFSFVLLFITFYYKSMPRPTQRRDGVVRSIRQPVAFSVSEYGQLQRDAYDSNISVSELIRFRALTRKVERPREPPLLDEQLYKELNSLGIDLNQVTHKVNAAISVDIDPSRYIDKVKELNSRLSLLLSQIHTGLETADLKRLPIESRKVGQSQSERRLSVRLAPDEYETIKQKARKAKVTIPQFIRRAALRIQVTQLPPPPVINWQLYRTHLTSFAGVLGFEVSRYFAINNRACLTRLFFARTGIKPASCKAFSFRNRSQMGSIES